MNAQKTGSLILETRTKLNMTQRELAEKINVSEKAVSKWENGRGCPECGNIITSTNQIELNCCGHTLKELISENEPDSSIIKSIEESDNQFFLTFKSPMTKTDYIAGVVTSTYTRTTVIPMFAEQEPSVTLPQISGVKVFVITNNNVCIQAS